MNINSDKSFSYFEQLDNLTKGIKDFINLPVGIFSEYENFFKEKVVIAQSAILNDANLFEAGKEAGKNLVSPDIAKSCITNFFLAQKEFLKVFKNAVQIEIDRASDIEAELAKELEKWELKIDLNDPDSELSKKRRQVEKLKEKLEQLIEHDYSWDLEKKYFEDLKKSQASLIDIHTQLAKVQEETLVTVSRKELTEELKVTIQKEALSWNEKVKEVKEKLNTYSELIEAVRKNQKDVVSFYGQSIDNHIEIQSKINSYNKEAIPAEHKQKISSRLQIITTFLFFIASAIAEVCIVYNISVNALGFDDGWGQILFVIGYPIAIGMAIKMYIQNAAEPKKAMKRISNIALTTCIIGIIGVGVINTKWVNDSNYEDVPIVISDGSYLGVEEQSIISAENLKICKAITFISFSFFFGAIAGLLYISFFQQYEKYKIIKKSFGLFGSYDNRIRIEINLVNNEIDQLFLTRNRFVFELLQIGNLKKSREILTDDFCSWIETLKIYAVTRFEAGYEVGKAEYRSTVDEHDIIAANYKNQSINKTIHLARHQSNGNN